MNPTQAVSSRFDKTGEGFVMGEGAGLVRTGNPRNNALARGRDALGGNRWFTVTVGRPLII